MRQKPVVSVERTGDQVNVRFTHACTDDVVDVSQLKTARDGGWDLLIEDGLVTLRPSLECTECGLHGYWIESEWKTA